MAEAPVTAAFGQHAGPAGLGEAGGDPGRVPPGGGGEQRRIDDVAGDGRQVDERARLGRDAIQALADDVAHAVRNHAFGDRLGALLVPQAQHLLEEQRVALAAIVDARLDVRRHRPDALLHETGRRRAIQARQRQRRPLAADARQEVAGGGVHARLDVAVAAEQQHPHRAQLAGDKVQQRQRRLIARVQIVEHEERRLRLRRFVHQRAHRAPQPEAPFLDRGRRPRRRLGEPRVQLRHDLAQQRRAVADDARERRVVEPARELRDQIEPRPIRGRPARLPAAPPQHREAALDRQRRGPIGEAGLADAGLARQQDELPPPRRRPFERGADLGELALAPDEHGGSSSDGQNETEASRYTNCCIRLS